MSLPGRFLCATHLLRGITEKPALGKAQFSSPALHLSSPYYTWKETAHFVKYLSSGNLCCKHLFVFLKGSPAGKPSRAGCCVTDAPPHLSTFPKAAKCSSQVSDPAGGRDGRRLLILSLHFHTEIMTFTMIRQVSLFLRPGGFATSPEVTSNQPLSMKCSIFGGTM